MACGCHETNPKKLAQPPAHLRPQQAPRRKAQPPTSAHMMCVVAFAAAWLPALPLPRKAAYLRLGGPVLMTDAEDGDATLTTHYRPRSAPS